MDNYHSSRSLILRMGSASSPAAFDAFKDNYPELRNMRAMTTRSLAHDVGHNEVVLHDMQNVQDEGSGQSRGVGCEDVFETQLLHCWVLTIAGSDDPWCL